MLRHLKNSVQTIIEVSGFEQHIRNQLHKSNYFQQISAFSPYIKELSVNGKVFRFFFATPEASSWYDPMKPYATAEYEWLLNHVNLRQQKIIDAGAHHGQYTIVFALGGQKSSQIVAVDPFPSNCAIIEANLAINNFQAQVSQCAVSNSNSQVQFSNRSNGHIVENGGVSVPSKRLASILPDATIIKLDIEGAEFSVLPEQIDDLPSCHTWIVEVHPGANRTPEVLTNAFKKRGFSVFWVNRHRLVVEPYPQSALWDIHTTIFAVRLPGPN